MIIIPSYPFCSACVARFVSCICPSGVFRSMVVCSIVFRCGCGSFSRSLSTAVLCVRGVGLYPFLKCVRGSVSNRCSVESCAFMSSFLYSCVMRVWKVWLMISPSSTIPSSSGSICRVFWISWWFSSASFMCGKLFRILPFLLCRVVAFLVMIAITLTPSSFTSMIFLPVMCFVWFLLSLASWHSKVLIVCFLCSGWFLMILLIVFSVIPHLRSFCRILLIQLSHCGFVALFLIVSISSFAWFPVAFLVCSVFKSCSSSSCVIPGPFVPFGSCWM